MNNLRRFLLLSLTLGVALSARAETAPAPRAASPLLASVFAALDTDHNGVLSAAEITAAPVALAALDRNDDGNISPDEWRTADGEGRFARSARTASFNLVFALDANHDGDIQPMEIANAGSSLKRLDANRDGELGRSELRPVMVARN